jgi:hypothetical protein
MHDLLAAIVEFFVDVASYFLTDASSKKLKEAIDNSERRRALKKENG